MSGIVEQCDREAAADVLSILDTSDQNMGMIAHWVRAGRLDGEPIVCAFAQHRLAALVSAPAGDGELPDILPGHWEGGDGVAIARHYAQAERSALCKGDLSDMALANAVYLAGRNDLDLIVWQTAAKERIRWLSAQLAAALASLRAAAVPAGTNIDYETVLFDVLETLKARFPSIAGGFARMTGGVDRDYIVDELRVAPSAKSDDWQPIETAPRDGSWFITKTDDRDYPYDVARYDHQHGDFVKAGCGYQFVRYWKSAEG